MVLWWKTVIQQFARADGGPEFVPHWPGQRGVHIVVGHRHLPDRQLQLQPESRQHLIGPGPRRQHQRLRGIGAGRAVNEVGAARRLPRAKRGGAVLQQLRAVLPGQRRESGQRALDDDGGAAGLRQAVVLRRQLPEHRVGLQQRGAVARGVGDAELRHHIGALREIAFDAVGVHAVEQQAVAPQQRLAAASLDLVPLRQCGLGQARHRGVGIHDAEHARITIGAGARIAEFVLLEKHRAPPGRGCVIGGGQAGGATADDGDIDFADFRRHSRWLA